MMQPRGRFWLSVFCLLITGCAAGRQVIEVGGYDFDFQGETYRIESVNPRSQVGYNLLAMKQGEENLVLGLDYDQDGTLDGVAEGKITLQRANEIYLAGIAEGERLGRVRSLVQTEEYRVVINQCTYVLVTYRLAIGSVLNKLTITTTQYGPEMAIIIDLDADGRLDTIEKGDGDLESYQALYDLVLDRGMRYGRIIKAEGLYLVIPPDASTLAGGQPRQD